jgi:hypothetical protein
MDQSDGAMAVVTSLRRSGTVTHADLRHRGGEKKARTPPRVSADDFCTPPRVSAVDFRAPLR